MNLSEILQIGKEAAPDPRASDRFTVRRTIIEHPIFCEIVREIARIHDRGVNLGLAEGLLIVAQTGGGKTTLLEWYVSKFPRSDENGARRIPVVLVVTPEAPTVKTLAEAILRALGDPAASKGTAQEKTARVLHFFKECGVRMLLVDEFQHFYDGRRGAECARVSDWLKNLINISNVPIVLAGLPRSIAVINMNPQLRRRFGAPVYMRPFDCSTRDREMEFRSVLRKIWSRIPVPCIAFHEANVARRFLYASCGLIDYIIKIVEEAVTRVPYDEKAGIGLATLAEAFKSAVWRLAPAHLNPFGPNPKLRRLDRRLEPFDIWDDPEQYQINATRPPRKRTQLDG